jgi:hypothetical protein
MIGTSSLCIHLTFHIQTLWQTNHSEDSCLLNSFGGALTSGKKSISSLENGRSATFAEPEQNERGCVPMDTM